MNQDMPFEIASLEPCGLAATNGQLTASVLEPHGKMFRRRAVKNVGSGNATAVEWLVIELDGVRVYVDKSSVVVTHRDLRP